MKNEKKLQLKNEYRGKKTIIGLYEKNYNHYLHKPLAYICINDTMGNINEDMDILHQLKENPITSHYIEEIDIIRPKYIYTLSQPGIVKKFNFIEYLYDPNIPSGKRRENYIILDDGMRRLSNDMYGDKTQRELKRYYNRISKLISKGYIEDINIEDYIKKNKRTL